LLGQEPERCCGRRGEFVKESSRTSATMLVPVVLYLERVQRGNVRLAAFHGRLP
jgi:hypothetical protein